MTSHPFRTTRLNSELWLTQIAEMERGELIEQFRSYPAPFPIDFSDAFLAEQPLDKLRHVFAGLVLHCGIAPRRSELSAIAA